MGFMTTIPPVQITGLDKSFGKTQVLHGVNMHVNAGTVQGFLGPNGAGKSTTIRCLLGLIRPSAGTVRLNGVDPFKSGAEATRRASYVPGDVSLWPGLTGGQVLETLARLRGKAQGSKSGDNLKYRKMLIERFGLDPSKKIRTYSKGNRQKVMLIAALAANADVIILDEPTTGLDPLMMHAFVTSIKERRAEGAAILLSSHILAEVHQLADEISIIKDGRIIESGTMDTIAHMRGMKIAATLPTGQPYAQVLPEDRANASLRTLLDQGATDITATPPSLEELFLQFYTTDRQVRP